MKKLPLACPAPAPALWSPTTDARDKSHQHFWDHVLWHLLPSVGSSQPYDLLMLGDHLIPEIQKFTQINLRLKLLTNWLHYIHDMIICIEIYIYTYMFIVSKIYNSSTWTFLVWSFRRGSSVHLEPARQSMAGQPTPLSNWKYHINSTKGFIASSLLNQGKKPMGFSFDQAWPGGDFLGQFTGGFFERWLPIPFFSQVTQILPMFYLKPCSFCFWSPRRRAHDRVEMQAFVEVPWTKLRLRKGQRKMRGCWRMSWDDRWGFSMAYA